MLDLIVQILAGSFTTFGLAASLFWPFVSIADLIKLAGLLVAAALVELWTRKFRGRRSADRKHFREDA